MRPIQLPGETHGVTAARDEAGVPHVKAKDLQGALFGLGFIHGHDRGTQLLFARTIAAGRAAEMIADSHELLETDRFFRRIGLAGPLAVEVTSLEAGVYEQLSIYAEGVNRGLAAAGRSWPMWATGYEHEPWDETAVLLVGQLLSFGGLAVSQMQNERLLLDLIQAGVGDEALRELFSPRLDGVDLDLLRKVKFARQLSDDALEVLVDLPRLAGSNAWAVSPSRSKTGGALLAADPHLEINRLPAIWCEVVLEFGDRYVMGATLPGCPLFAVARTDRLAWGVTYMKGDTVDYFVEDCRRGGETGWQYRRGDAWRDFELREETVGRKGGEPLALKVFENQQGTLDGDPDDLGEGLQLSLAWAGMHAGAGRAISAWLELLQAETAKDAMDVARECPHPTLCWVFADRAGHIGMQAAGRFPTRGNGYDGLTPIPAWEEANHWGPWRLKKHLPRIYDPPEGFIATANEAIQPSEGPLLVTQLLPDYRRRRILERLGELPAATVEEMQSLQYDVVSLQARTLLNVFLPHLPDGDVKDRLAAWDCRYTAESTEAALFHRLYRNVLMQVFGHEQGVGWRRMLYLSSRAGYSSMVTAAADRLLTKDESVWFAGREKGELIRAAAEMLEGRVDRPWSSVNYFHFTDRFFGNHQVGRLLGFSSRRYPMPGCAATPFQGHVMQTASRETTFAPSFHFVTDLSTDEAHTNLPGGPSESRFSRYYNSDVPRWLAGEYKRLTPTIH